MREKVETKRRTSARHPMHVFRANMRRKKQRAATSVSDADFGNDAPSLGVGRGLIVIALLHVVAIAGIIIHDKWFDKTQQPKAGKLSAIIAETIGDVKGEVHTDDKHTEKPKATAPNKKQAQHQHLLAPASPSAKTTEPRFYLDAPMPGDAQTLDHYIIETGDNYARVAAKYQIAESELRRANKDRVLKAGTILVIPAPRLVAQEPDDMKKLAANERFEKFIPTAEIPDSGADISEKTSPKQQAVLIKPKRMHITADVPRAVIVSEEEVVTAKQRVATDSGKRYTVKAGDSVWRIAQRLKVNQSELLRINGIDKAGKLSLGQELIVPR